MNKQCKPILCVLLSVLLLFSCIPVAMAADEVPEGYTGVYSVEDLYVIRYALNQNYILMNDIDLTEDTAPGGDWDNGYGWAPIGEDDKLPFTGTFDGNGHTITGLQINSIKTKFAGLFGYVTGDIKNLTLDNAIITTITDCTYAGSVAAYSTGNFENITVSNLSMNTKSKYSGGVSAYTTGDFEHITVSNISLTSTSLSRYTAGLVGYWNGLSIKDVKVDGSISQNFNTSSEDLSAYAGGIVAYCDNEAAIERCVNNAAVSGKQTNSHYDSTRYETDKSAYGRYYAGGICGYVNNANAVIRLCYNAGLVSANNHTSASFVCGYPFGNAHRLFYSNAYSYAYAGGIAGLSLGQTEDCYNLTEITADTTASAENTYGPANGSYARTYTYSISSGITGKGKATRCINLGQVSGTGKVITLSAIAYGTLQNCYYLRGTADAGKSGETDTATTAVALSEAQMKLKALFGYLDFENVWFLDTSSGIEHPQLIANPEFVIHKHTYSAEVTAPTCTERGYTTYTCACGDTYKDNYTDALGHDFSEWNTTTAATCTVAGEKTRECSRCEVVETEAIEALGHNFSEWATTTEAM